MASSNSRQPHGRIDVKTVFFATSRVDQGSIMDNNWLMETGPLQNAARHNGSRRRSTFRGGDLARKQNRGNAPYRDT